MTTGAFGSEIAIANAGSASEVLPAPSRYSATSTLTSRVRLQIAAYSSDHSSLRTRSSWRRLPCVPTELMQSNTSSTSFRLRWMRR